MYAADMRICGETWSSYFKVCSRASKRHLYFTNTKPGSEEQGCG